MYFITICTQNRECLFGEITDGAMQVNFAGKMIQKWWSELIKKFKDIELDEFIIMPNHIHGIILINIVGATLCGRPDLMNEQYQKTGQPHRVAPTLGDIMDWFKTMTTNEYIVGVNMHGWPRFNGKLWQRNYYEHIIRNGDDLNTIREYIAMNPMRWAEDEENPNRLKR